MPRTTEYITPWCKYVRAALFCVCLAGCAKQPESQEYVARVGSAVLTNEDVEAMRDSVGTERFRVRDFVNDWITDEMLYQESVRRGLADTDDLRRQLEVIRRRLAIDALLAHEIYTQDTSSIGDDAIAGVYASGGSAFLLKEDVINASYALFSDRDAANTFRSNLLRGASWSEALLTIQQDSLLRPQLLRVATRQYFTRATMYPEELWKLARNSTREDVSFVLQTDGGYHVLVVHSFTQQGEMPGMDYVRNEIRDRLLIEQRRLSYERLLGMVRTKQMVEVRSLGSDTAYTH